MTGKNPKITYPADFEKFYEQADEKLLKNLTYIGYARTINFIKQLASAVNKTKENQSGEEK